MEPTDPNTQQKPPSSPETGSEQSGTIDMQKLADKVYRLMLADLRLDRKRGTQAQQRRNP